MDEGPQLTPPQNRQVHLLLIPLTHGPPTKELRLIKQLEAALGGQPDNHYDNHKNT